MDANTTAAVDILIRSSMGQATADFQKILSQMESDARAFAERLKTIFANVNLADMFNNKKGQSTSGGGTNARGSIPLGGTGDALKDQAMKDIANMQKQRILMEREITRQLEKEATTQANDRVKAYKRSMNDIANSVRESNKTFTSIGEKAGNAFNSAFAGTFLGLSAQQGIVYSIRKLYDFLKDIFDQSLTFSNAVTALAQFEGSAEKARQKVVELIKVANETPGLTFNSAVLGQQKLEAVGFASEKATRLLAGLAKIRILSGTTQQDFDIMITELAKFSQGGEQTGRIFRELANHMSALIPIIKQHFGSLNEETVKAAGGPQKFLEKLIDVLDTVNPKFNETSLAVENLNDSYTRWKISLGSIIERNPDLVAALNVTTNTINKNTEALNENDNQVRTNADTWVTRFAKMIIAAQNFGDKVIAVVNDAGTVVGDLAGVVEASWMDSLHTIGAGFDVLLISPLNTALAQLNNIKNELATIPGLSGLSQMPDLQFKYITGDPNQPGFFQQDFGINGRVARSRLMTDSKYANSQYATADRVAQQRWADLQAERDRIVNDQGAQNTSLFRYRFKIDNMSGDTSGNDVGTPKGAQRFSEDLQGAQKEAAVSGFQNALTKLSPGLRGQILDAAAKYGIPSAIALAQIFQESTFKGGAVSNQGAYGLTQMKPATASNALGRNVTGSQLVNDPLLALQGWGAEMARLYQKYGDWNIVALAYHGGEGTANTYLRAAESGKKALATFAHDHPRSFQYVQLLRARTGLGSGASDLSGLSDTLTKEQREASDRQYIDLISRFPNLFGGSAYGKEGSAIVERAAQSLARQKGVAQPQGVAAQLALLGVAGQSQALQLTGTPISAAGFNVRPTPSEAYTQAVKNELNVDQRITQDLARRDQLDKEITERARDYSQLLREQSTEAKVQLGVAERRRPLDEAQVEVQQRRVSLTNEAKDNEREIAALQLENADKNLTALRQMNAINRDRLNIEHSIADLNDANASMDANAALRVQRDLLSDIVDLRKEEYDAISDTNKAILEINRQTEYSATRANAEVLKFMASQKGVTESMADFKIGLVESGYDLIDRGLDKILPKFGKLTDTVHEFIASILKLGANWVFRKLFGLDTGIQGVPQTGGGGSTAGGLFSTISRFLSGGSLSGGGTGGGLAGATFGGGAIPGIPYAMSFGGGGGQGTGAFGSSPLNIGQLLHAFTGGGATPVTSQDITLGGLVGTGGVTGDHGAIHNAPAQVGGLSGLFKSKAFQNQLAGALAGGTLGAGLGGQSAGGQILGGVGGAIAGTLLTGLITTGSIGGATTGGIFGSTAGLFGLSGAATFGIGLAIAGALLLGSWLFGRSSREKAEKKQVTQLSGDAISRIQQLIDDVKHFKIDGATAYDQGTQIRDQFAQQITQLKSGAGKRLAQQQLSQINTMLQTLKNEGDKADRQKNIASIMDEKVVPTFATGGMGSAFTGYGGYGGGVQLVGVHSNEAIINASEIMALGGYRRLQDVGVRGINMSGAPERNWNGLRPSIAPTNADNRPTYNAFFMDESAADSWLEKVAPSGVAKKMRIAVHTDDDQGFTDTLTKKLTE